MRKLLVSVFAVSFVAALARAEDLTLPAAASIVGGAPFFSDVRAFNTSYTDNLDVTARYRCFLPAGCTATNVQIQFELAPRESRAFNDMVAVAFASPDTAGGVEFEHSGSGDQLVVTSRLYSTAPQPTVGMFIPGLRNSEAHATTVLTSIRNGGAGAGFRTNVGVYNREDSAVNVTFTIFDAGAQVGNPVTRSVGAHSGTQVNGVFNAAGQGGHATENAVIVVSASHEVFSYAAVIDNNTTDPIFVVGAEDQPEQPVTPVNTVTPSQPAATATRTPTRTPTQPSPGVRIVNVGGAGFNFTDQVSGTSTTSITTGTTVRWVWVSGTHSTTSGSCPGGTCTADGIWSSPSGIGLTFEHTFNAVGDFDYFCNVHRAMMQGQVVVSNP
jgi:plastocyanin